MPRAQDHLRRRRRAPRAADLRRAETDLAAVRRDYSTVSGELVWQLARTRSPEEEGGLMLRQFADAQRAGCDVAGVVDKRLITATFLPSRRLHTKCGTSASPSPHWSQP